MTSFPSTLEIMLKVNFNIFCINFLLKLFSHSARKKLEAFVPIVKKDLDIISLQSRQYQDVESIIDIFVRAQTPVHILRAVEPTLRLGMHLDKFLDNMSGQALPKCQFLNTTFDWKCINFASRKQLGEAIVALQSLGRN